MARPTYGELLGIARGDTSKLLAVLASGRRPDGTSFDAVAFADESITVSDSAVGLTEATYAPDGEDQATEATVVVVGQPIMLRYSGTEVTTTEGIPLAAGAVWVVSGAENIAQARLIRTGGTDATVYVLYGR